MPKLPVVSGKELSKLLRALDYTLVRQRGSHARYCKTTPAGEHNITIPMHSEIAKGTLNDILAKVGVWNSMSREDLLRKLKS